MRKNTHSLAIHWEAKFRESSFFKLALCVWTKEMWLESPEGSAHSELETVLSRLMVIIHVTVRHHV